MITLLSKFWDRIRGRKYFYGKITEVEPWPQVEGHITDIKFTQSTATNLVEMYKGDGNIYENKELLK